MLSPPNETKSFCPDLENIGNGLSWLTSIKTTTLQHPPKPLLIQVGQQTRSIDARRKLRNHSAVRRKQHAAPSTAPGAAETSPTDASVVFRSPPQRSECNRN